MLAGLSCLVIFLRMTKEGGECDYLWKSSVEWRRIDTSGGFFAKRLRMTKV